MSDRRRTLPSVGALLESDAVRELLAIAPRAVVADAVRDAVAAARRSAGPAPATPGEWALAVEQALTRRTRSSLRAALNATGVVLHTNLGRAPLAPAARAAVDAIAEGFSNLEYDLERGARGSRYAHAAALIRELTGAEDALVVNNCAAALVLVLNTVADGREAIVSRGELVEIGGSFRVPDIMGKSGARLREVGTTNRTHLDDYRRVLGPDTGAILKVHRGNFAMAGFVADVGVRELLPLAREAAVPLVHDLGSGLLVSLDAYGLEGEPTVREALQAGASLVTFSGDKLLGGPQAGIIAGDAALVARMRENPLARALRVDKLTLAALEATLALYRDPERAVREVPALAMLTAPVSEVRGRAESLAADLEARGVRARVRDSVATVGGGAFPTARIPSCAVVLPGDPESLARRLRAAEPPVIGRIEDDALLLDLRSVAPAHDARLAAAVTDSLAE
ncbi:MAG TPA: L-seryl-tRNA(Sec) selenium transferase [Gemmatimonadaceae bacterium]|nr:L-seryl-tRNA(Sec) selenium transferase [Gemmatimonadaceae bacterium]